MNKCSNRCAILILTTAKEATKVQIVSEKIIFPYYHERSSLSAKHEIKLEEFYCLLLLINFIQCILDRELASNM